MSADFDNLIDDIEREARDEGPQAVRELEQLRKEFKLASAAIGISGPKRMFGEQNGEQTEPNP